MTAHIKSSGNWDQAQQLFVKTQGIQEEVLQGYYKQAGVWGLVYENLFAVSLATSNDVNLANYLASIPAPLGANIEVTIPAGVTIGSTIAGLPALDIGNISGLYNSVTVIVQGDVLGYGGVVSAPNGGPAIISNTFFGLIISGNGRVNGGGGRGGNGGDGADGIGFSTDWSGAWSYNRLSTAFRFSREPGGSWSSRWSDTSLYPGDNDILADYIQSNATGSFYFYQRGAQRDNSPLLYEIRRRGQLPISIAGGNGAAGGDGQGANNLTANSGSSGSNASGWDGGDGGSSGSGGNWGMPGNIGGAGGEGFKYVWTGYTPPGGDDSGRVRVPTTTAGGAGAAGVAGNSVISIQATLDAIQILDSGQRNGPLLAI